MKLLNRTCIFLGLLCVGFVISQKIDSVSEDEHKLQGIIDNLVNSTINKLLANLSEPMELGNLPLNMTGNILSGKANFSDITISGLKGMVATVIDVSILTMKMNATIIIPAVGFNLSYIADLVMAEFVPLYGNGNMGMAIDNIEMIMTGKVNLTGGIGIGNVSIEFTLGDMMLNLQGLLNNEELSEFTSQIVNEILEPLVKLINENKKSIGEFISPIVQKLLDSLLSPNKTTNVLAEEIHLNSVDKTIELSPIL